MKKWLFLSVLLFGVVTSLYSQNDTKMKAGGREQTTEIETTNATVERRPFVNSKAPLFKLPTLKGNQQLSLKHAAGQPLIINFWTSWCTYCKDEAESFNRIYNQYRDQLKIYAINLTNSDKLTDVKAFVNNFNYEFPVLLDKNGNVAEAYRIAALPTTLFLNSNGKIVYRHNGYLSYEKLNNIVQRLL